MSLKANDYPYLDTASPLAIAHRGGAAQWPENTLEAFRGAYQLGFRCMETDAHLTRDGQVVAFHDPDLTRLSGRGQLISQMNWRDIQQLELSGGGRVSLMSELLEELPDARFNIDMKCDAVVEPLIQLVRDTSIGPRVCLASFFDHRIRRVYQELGDVICMSAGRRAVALQVARSRGLIWAAPKVPLLQVPISKAGVEIVTKRFVDLCHAEGKHVHVWTIDDPAEMHRLLDLGVDGIMTDQPKILRQVMQHRGEWKS